MESWQHRPCDHFKFPHLQAADSDVDHDLNASGLGDESVDGKNDRRDDEEENWQIGEDGRRDDEEKA